MKKYLFLLSTFYFLLVAPAAAVSVVATVNGAPITSADITARVRLMAAQGHTGTDNRVRALSNIIDDHLRLSHAQSMHIMPTDEDINREIADLRRRGMDTSGLGAVGNEMMRSAARANIAWQMVLGRTVLPTITITDEDIENEMSELSRTRGLPINTTVIRLVEIPRSVADRLTTPTSCDDAMRMARNLGGSPLRLTVPEYELAPDVREKIWNLETLEWSPWANRSVLLVCERVRMATWGDLDDIIRQNTTWRRAMFIGDQNLRQLRRRAVIVINDERYRGALN